jgi:ribonuclease BN (tRNA processing enzyme)
MTTTVTFVGSGDSFGAGGRFQTCILVDAPGIRFAVDFGTSSLIALNQLGIDHNTIDAIVLTHLHGDHCGGVPFMLMDAMLGARRQRPLTIAGPPETQSRLGVIQEALFPGSVVMAPKFPLQYVEMKSLRSNAVLSLEVTPYPAHHTEQTNPTSLRIRCGDKIVCYTGDSSWTAHMPVMAKDADLLILESYFYEKPIRFHLNYPDIKQHWGELKAKRAILTHMSREMLPMAGKVPEECAHDGLVVHI